MVLPFSRSPTHTYFLEICAAQQSGIFLIMKNVSVSGVDKQVLLSFSSASRMTDDIRRSNEERQGREQGEDRGRKKRKKASRERGDYEERGQTEERWGSK